MPPMVQAVVPSAMPVAPESELHCTRVTLSVAVPFRATVAVPLVQRESAVGEVMLSLGSGSGRITVSTALVMSPPETAAAVTVTIVVPELIARPGIVHLDVPSATPLSPLSVTQRTTEMPDAWLATPPSVMEAAVAVYCAAAVGARIRTTGGDAGGSFVDCSFEGAAASLALEGESCDGMLGGAAVWCIACDVTGVLELAAATL